MPLSPGGGGGGGGGGGVEGGGGGGGGDGVEGGAAVVASGHWKRRGAVLSTTLAPTFGCQYQLTSSRSKNVGDAVAVQSVNDAKKTACKKTDVIVCSVNSKIDSLSIENGLDKRIEKEKNRNGNQGRKPTKKLRNYLVLE